MIELCSKKRMVVAILLLISLSILTLILETRWSNEHKLKEAHIYAQGHVNESCKSGSVNILEECKRCPRTELRNLVSYCMTTGFKELVECDGGKKLYRGCDISPSVEQRSFWIFEVVCLGLGITSYLVVFFRQRSLDNMMTEKINRQIAAAL